MDQITPTGNLVKVLVIVGPTASGKTALGIELAKKYNGEIISADSRQVYRGMDIGTAKDKSFPQHLIDVADPKDDYNVSHFVTDAKKAIEEISAQGKLPIIVGGSGFWIDSLVFGYELPEIKPNERLRRDLEKKSAGMLFAELERIDHHRAKHIDKHNKRRLIRAIELVHETGQPVPVLRKQSNYEALWIGIKANKEKLDRRIEERFREGMHKGLIEETKRLHEQGVSWARLEALGMEYRAVARHLQDLTTKDEMMTEAIHSIQQYAKRQVTWFKRNKNIHWLSPEASAQESQELLRDFLSLS